MPSVWWSSTRDAGHQGQKVEDMWKATLWVLFGAPAWFVNVSGGNRRMRGNGSNLVHVGVWSCQIPGQLTRERRILFPSRFLSGHHSYVCSSLGLRSLWQRYLSKREWWVLSNEYLMDHFTSFTSYTRRWAKRRENVYFTDHSSFLTNLSHYSCFSRQSSSELISSFHSIVCSLTIQARKYASYFFCFPHGAEFLLQKVHLAFHSFFTSQSFFFYSLPQLFIFSLLQWWYLNK